MNANEFNSHKDEIINTKLVKKSSNTTKIIFGEVPYVSLNIFEKYDEVLASFSTRFGGVSEGQFSTMNFCTSLGDSIDNVRKNFELYGKASRHNNFMLSKQTHTTNVLKVSEEHIGMGLTKEMTYDNVDGLVTNMKGVTLSTFYADCVPLYFYDPVNKAIGLSHAGWRGTVGNMVESTLNVMKKEFNTNPEDVISAIGPSICVNCYEVSSDVAYEFINAFEISEDIIVNIKDNTDIDDKAMDMNRIIYKGENDKYFLNLWAANYINMVKSGIKPENISIPDMCTNENKDILFSHRGLNGKRGNLGAFLMLKN